MPEPAPTNEQYVALEARVTALEVRMANTPPPAPFDGTYTVVTGDTLSGIAARHLVTVAELVAWNAIADPNVIQVGQVLTTVAPEKEKTPNLNPEPDPEPQPKPDPEPQPGGLPVGVTLFADDFTSGSLARWQAVQTAPTGDKRPAREVPGHVELVDGAVVFTRPRGGGERSEVLPGGVCDVAEGDTRLITLDWMFPADFPTPTGKWCIVYQQHAGQVGGSPAFAIEVDRSDRLVIRNNRLNDAPTVIGPIDRGVRHRYDVAVRFATSGWVQVWRDGVEVVPRTPRRTTPADYAKVGLYVGGDTAEFSVRLGAFRFAALR